MSLSKHDIEVGKAYTDASGHERTVLAMVNDGEDVVYYQVEHRRQGMKAEGLVQACLLQAFAQWAEKESE